MKKLVIGIILTVAVLLTFIYLFIPGKIKINESIPLKAALPGVSRLLADDKNWDRWWPGKQTFDFNDNHFLLKGAIFNQFDITIINKKDSIKSRITLILVNNDSMTVDWNTDIFTSTNPLNRLTQYNRSRQLKKDLHTILTNLKIFVEKTENIYGIVVQKKFVQDSVLISTRSSFDHKPGVKEIDAMIQKLRAYIAENKAVEKNLPMLNVLMIDSSHYEAMTAIPVDRELPATREFAPKFLLKGGNILETQIQGGPHTIEKAFNELENYRSDHKYTSPAIPFQLLITDRAKEADSTKWITKLYYPIF